MNPLAISSTNAGRRSELTAPCMFNPIVTFLSYYNNSYSFMARDGAPSINDNFRKHLLFFFYTITKTAKALGRTLLPSGLQLFHPPGDPCSARQLRYKHSFTSKRI